MSYEEVRAKVKAANAERDTMRPGLICSAVLHLTVLVIMVLGLPNFWSSPPPQDEPIAVQLVNMADVTRALHRNPHPVAKAKIDTPPPPTPVETPKPVKPDVLNPEPAPPAASEVAQETPPTPEPPKPAPPPEPAPAPPPVPKPAPIKPPPPKPAPPKPAPPKPAKTKPKPTKLAKQQDSLDSLLKNLSNETVKPDKTDTPPKKPPTEVASAEASAEPDAPLGDQLTTSQIDTIRSQFEKCWNVPAGARDAKNLRVEIRVAVNPDGTVQSARIIDSEGKYGTDTFWRAAADSALRAVNNPQCSKLDVPADKYDVWKNLDLFFDPKDML